MKSLKEYFKNNLKRQLAEDLTTPEVTAYMRRLSHASSKRGNAAESDRIDREREEMEKSPHLYRMNSTTGNPEKVEGVRISPALHAAINAAVIDGEDGEDLSPHHIRQLRSFVQQHGDVVGRAVGTPWQYTSRAVAPSSPDSLQYSTSRGLDDSDMIHRNIDPLSRMLGGRDRASRRYDL